MIKKSAFGKYSSFGNTEVYDFYDIITNKITPDKVKSLYYNSIIELPDINNLKLENAYLNVSQNEYTGDFPEARNLFIYGGGEKTLDNISHKYENITIYFSNARYFNIPNGVKVVNLVNCGELNSIGIFEERNVSVNVYNGTKITEKSNKVFVKYFSDIPDELKKHFDVFKQFFIKETSRDLNGQIEYPVPPFTLYPSRPILGQPTVENQSYF